MKKRDKSKRYVMNLPLEVMPKRKQKFLYNITKKELEKAIRDVFKTEWKSTSMPPINSHWHDKALDVSRTLTYEQCEQIKHTGDIVNDHKYKRKKLILTTKEAK